jgi:hypothetical protein
MTKQNYFILYLSLLVIISSCTGPVAETKRKIKNIERYSILANEAAADLVIEKKEADELNNLAKKIAESDKKIFAECKQDTSSQSKVEKYKSKNKNEIVLAYNNLTLAIISLTKCKGYEQLEFE